MDNTATSISRFVLAVFASALGACSTPDRSDGAADSRVIIEDAATDSMCINPPTPATLNAPCRCDSDCRSGLQCVPTLPSPDGGVADGGMDEATCGLRCTTGDDCPIEAPACVDGRCDRSCLAAGQCPTGQHCLAVDGPGTCIAWCADSSECGTRTCSPYTGDCVSSATPPAGGETDAPCTVDSQCRSDLCGNDGLCFQLCLLSAQTCPTGEYCYTPSQTSMNEYGFCAQTCTTAADCRNPNAICAMPRGASTRICF